MCIFSGRVSSVASTKIFGRIDGGRQSLIYQMQFSTDDDTAMILPVPVMPGAPEDALRFVSLEAYPDIFDDIGKLFPAPRGMLSVGSSNAALRPALEVHSVGAFESSFVPTIADFARLDPRFSLNASLWQQMPQYKDFGFAVFKLKGGGHQKVHPMAFTFPTRNPEQLFFPTLHVHDGELHERADFNHALYGQAEQIEEWVRAGYSVSERVDIDRAQGLVSSSAPVWRLLLDGQFSNADVYASVA